MSLSTLITLDIVQYSCIINFKSSEHTHPQFTPFDVPPAHVCQPDRKELFVEHAVVVGLFKNL